MHKIATHYLKVKIFSFPLTIILITFIGLMLRLFIVGSNPPSLSWDEVAWGYNAYSLGIDLRDEFGVLLPYKYIESFGDFKPPLYAYLTILPIKLFGLTEFAVRFSSGFFGGLTVFVTYFLVKRLFITSPQKEIYAILTASILAISPWHIMLSRAAFEANIASFLLVAGIWAFLAGIQEKRWHLVLSAVFFALSFYTFNTPRIVAPLLVVGIAIFSWRRLIKIKKQVLISVLVGGLLILPIIPFLFSPQASLRFKEVNIFSDIKIIERTNQEIENDNGSIFSKVIHNRRIAYGIEYLKHYLDSFNPSFLFVNGDENRRFSTEDVGQLYLWELPFFIMGIGILFLKREGNWWIVPLWLLIGIIPAATARETPHALRIETTLPTYQIFTAIGLISLVLWFKSFATKKIFTAVLYLLCVSIFFNSVYFLHGYYRHYPRENSIEWQYGYKEAVFFAMDHEAEYDQIYITEQLGRPYIYILFYQKIDPKLFRETAKVHRDTYGFVNVKKFGKYNFGIDHKKLTSTGKILFINKADDVPQDSTHVKTFNLLNGKPILIAYTL